MAEEPATTEPKTQDADKRFDLARLVGSLVDRFGSERDALGKIVQENHDLRGKNRELADRVPKEGAVVITAEEAKLLARYRELGEPAAIAKTQQDFSQATTELQGLRRRGVIQEVAAVQGWKPAVLERLATPGLEFSISEQANGSKGAKAVTVKDGDSDPVLLDDYAKQHWGDFLGALKAESSRGFFVEPVTPNKPSVSPKEDKAPLPWARI